MLVPICEFATQLMPGTLIHRPLTRTGQLADIAMNPPGSPGKRPYLYTVAYDRHVGLFEPQVCCWMRQTGMITLVERNNLPDDWLGLEITDMRPRILFTKVVRGDTAEYLRYLLELVEEVGTDPNSVVAPKLPNSIKPFRRTMLVPIEGSEPHSVDANQVFFS